MPITLNCPGGPVAGPEATATDGALGFSAVRALRNAHRDAHEEANSKVAEEITDNYRCQSGCRISMGPITPLGHRPLGPARRVWWTLWILFWAEYEVKVTRFVQCVPIPEED